MSRQDNKLIDDIARLSGRARVYGSISDLYAGYDHRNAGSAFSKNKDHFGLVFFTRPRMNMSYNNIIEDRHFEPMMREDPKSLHNALRLMFDDRLPRLIHHPDHGNVGTVSSIFDNRQAFLPLITNTCTSISGWPDIVVNSYQSQEGIRKEVYGFVDDIADINGSFDLHLTLDNLEGNPHTSFFQFWTRYMSNVYTGHFVPYPDYIIENRIDYNTSAFRLVLDRTKKFVTNIARAHGGYPQASPLGNLFNYSKESPYQNYVDQVTVPMRFYGAEYNDPINIDEFNLIVGMYNPDMRDDRRSQSMHKLDHREITSMNYRGFPRIDPTTMELEWWVDADDRAAIVSTESVFNQTEGSFQDDRSNGYINTITGNPTL